MSVAKSTIFNRKQFVKDLETENPITVFKKSIKTAKDVLEKKHFAGASACLLYTSPSPRDRG